MKNIARRRPAIHGQPANAFDVSGQQATAIKKFNENIRYIQGFRATIPQGTSTLNINLNASGRFMLGVAVIPVSGADITDTTGSLSVNNNNLLLGANLANFNPNFVQGLEYIATPQPLVGNDTISWQFNKTNASTIYAYINIFYVPRIK